jgi:hypothetical protein
VVWIDLRSGVDIYGSRVTRGGAVLDEAGLRLTSLSGSETHPALAFDGTNYLMVWYHQGNSPGMPDEILGVLLTSSGDALRVIHISSRVVNFRSVNPVVAFDGTNFLVVWEGLCGGICGARVSPSGIVLDDAEIPISGFGGGDPAVAFDGANYLVVWSGDGLCVGICAARVSPSGTVLDPGGIPIGHGLFPAVTFAGGNYLVAWLRPTEIASIHEVYGARVSPSGTVLDSPGTRISRGIPGGISEGAGPAVAFDGTNALVVWRGWKAECATICGARVNSEGWVLDPDGIWISTPRPPPKRRCVVPRVVGLRLARAKARIRSFNCRVGRVRQVRSSRPGRVLAQSPRAGKQRPGGTRVNLVVGIRRR